MDFYQYKSLGKIILCCLIGKENDRNKGGIFHWQEREERVKGKKKVQ